MCIYSLQPGHLETEQNDRKVKRSTINICPNILNASACLTVRPLSQTIAQRQ